MEPTTLRVALVAIGDEVLRGDTVDSNRAFLGQRLSSCGLQVEYGLTLPDREEVISAELQRILPHFELVLTCGGIGPTPDDVTRQAVARAFGRELQFHPAAAERFARFIGRELNPGQRAMCTLPEGCELLWSPHSAAPAFRVEQLYALAGVPRILQETWAEIAGRFTGPSWFDQRFRAACAESRYAELMADFVRRYPQLSFGSYPKQDAEGWWAEIVVRGRDAQAVTRAAADFEKAIRALAAS